MKHGLVGSGPSARPAPIKLVDEIQAISDDIGVQPSSLERTQKAVNYARDRGAQLMSQKELRDGYVQGRPGFNPANPTGQSTHERRNDGVAYPGPARILLRYWMLGMDWVNAINARRACEAARRRGWIMTVTYPSQSNELHHTNFRKEPKLSIFKVLKEGSRSVRVRKLKNALHYVHSPKTDRRYFPHRAKGTRKEKNYFNKQLEDALKLFQKEHHQKPDGIYGPHSAKQLGVAIRREKKWRRKQRIRRRK